MKFVLWMQLDRDEDLLLRGFTKSVVALPHLQISVHR